MEAAPLSCRPVCLIRCIFQQHLLSNDYLCPVRGPWGKAISLRFPDCWVYQISHHLVGAFIGLLTAGPASDIFSANLTKRNNGIREPEMRLIAMVPYGLIMYFGQLCRRLWSSTSVGLENNRHHWFRLQRYTNRRSSINCGYLRYRLL